jgi:nitrate reductase cytochrome c-type subunit
VSQNKQTPNNNSINKIKTTTTQKQTKKKNQPTTLKKNYKCQPGMVAHAFNSSS